MRRRRLVRIPHHRLPLQVQPRLAGQLFGKNRHLPGVQVRHDLQRHEDGFVQENAKTLRIQRHRLLQNRRQPGS